jgi:predicted dehydrogenase
MEFTKEKIGWGILGPGRIAHQFCDCLNELDDAYVAAVGSRSFDRSKEFTDIYGGTPYGSYAKMLADPDVDIVYVATPHPMHEEHVIMAANAGKAILCEKPFAVNKTQAENMFAAAKANNVFIMEGLWSRFFPAWQYVREQLDSGRFGAVEQIYCSTGWSSDRNFDHIDPSNRIHSLDLAGGALLDAGIYSLAAMSRTRGKFDMPTEMYSSLSFDPTGVDGDDDIMLKFEDGMAAYLTSSLHRLDMECKIVCRKGIISIPVNRNPDKIVIQERQNFRPRRPAPEEKPAENKPKVEPAKQMRDYFSFMNQLPISQRRMGGHDTLTMEFPYRRSGFQFEAEVVQKCFRQGWKFCPDATPEETLMLISIADEARRRANIVYPFEK